MSVDSRSTPVASRSTPVERTESVVGRAPCFANVPGRGFGKIISESNGRSVVEFFQSPAGSDRTEENFASFELQALDPWPGTRCFIKGDGGRWSLGRVMGALNLRHAVETTYQVEVETDNGDGHKLISVSVSRLFVRSELALADPIDVIKFGCLHPPQSAKQRTAFVSQVLKQRELCQGLTALVTSRIELHRHQVEIIQRVLRDPVQRYLLADEVGLGKSVEAGVILRQFLLDERNLRVLVCVPDSLAQQWDEELDVKFGVRDFPQRVDVVGHTRLGMLENFSGYGLVVVDEVHNLVSEHLADGEVAQFGGLVEATRTIPRVLLLSATPLLHNEAVFLGILNLLDPDLYKTEELVAFTERVNSRQQFALEFQGFNVGKPAFLIETLAVSFKDQFPEDDALGVMLDEVLRLIESDVSAGEEFENLVRSIRSHLGETYRLHRRVLRTRRQSPLAQDFPVRGRCYGGELSHDVGAHRQREIEYVDEWMNRWLIELSRRVRHVEFTKWQALAITGLLERLQTLPAIAVRYCEVWLKRAKDDVQIAEVNRAESVGMEALEVTSQERVLLEELISHLETAGGVSHWAEVVALQANTLPSGSVIFCGYKQAAKEVARALNSSGHGALAKLVGGLGANGRESAFDAVAAVREGRYRYLVCSQEAEEGLNVQFAASILHAHLPWSVSRIEQRIGRVDRFGTGDPVRVHALAGMDAVTVAWGRFLHEGFGVFNESIATLQHVVERAQSSALHALVRAGVGALSQISEDLLVDLADEKDAILRFESLESIESESILNHDLFNSLKEVDRLAPGFEVASKAWMSGTAQDPAGRSAESSIGLRCRPGPVFMLPPRILQTGVPREVVSRYLGMDDATLVRVTFKRELGTSDPSAHLFRIGDEFLDRVIALTEADDLGQTFAFMRKAGLGQGQGQLVADMTFRIDGASRTVREYIGSLGLSERTGMAVAECVLRLVDGFFPPTTARVLLDREGRPLSPEYYVYMSESFKSSEDQVLTSSRIPALEHVFNVNWISWWEECRSAGLEMVRREIGFTQARTAALGRLEAARDELSRQLALRKGQGFSALEIASLERDLVQQDDLWRAVQQGLESIVPSLETVGAVVLGATW